MLIYVLQSLKHGRFYIGSTNDLNDRLKRHNFRKNKSTRDGVPWKLVHVEKFNTRSEAVKREIQIKKYKGGNAFKKLIKL